MASNQAAEFFRLVAQAYASVPGEIARAMSRFAIDTSTRQKMLRPVEKLRDVPVSGDVLAHVRKDVAGGRRG